MITRPPSAAATADIGHFVHTAAAAHAALRQRGIDRCPSHLRISGDFTLMAPSGGPPSPAAAPWALRRAENGRCFQGGPWDLAHHPADPLAEGLTLEQAAALAARRA